MLSFTNTVSQAMLQAIIDTAEAGSGPPYIRIYNGNIPIDAETFNQSALAPLEVGSDVLCEITLQSPVATAVNKRLVFNLPVAETTITSGGVASFFRLFDSDGNVILQGRCALEESETDIDMHFSNVNLEVSGTLQGVYFVIEFP